MAGAERAPTAVSKGCRYNFYTRAVTEHVLIFIVWEVNVMLSLQRWVVAVMIDDDSETT